MAFLQHQNVKYEKANAMRRFQLKQNLETIFHFLNLSIALFLFSRSSCFPIIVQAFWNLYTVLMPLFQNSFYAFLLLNAIVLFLYAISNKHGAGSGDECLEITAPEKKTETTPYCSENLVICNSEVGEKSSPVFEETETVTAVTETTTATCCTTVTTIGDNVSEKKCYRRVQSERRVVVAPRRAFKRFNTGQFQRPLRYVEQLSKDEFNRAVEDFIAKHKRMQWEEQIGSQNTEYLTVTQ